jgi:transcription elongation factor GreA
MEAKDVIYATAEGKKKLEKKLLDLIARRAEIAEQIKIAREFGDLKENAEYAAAREAQNNLETEIREIEEMLPRIKSFSYKNVKTDIVALGTRVQLELIPGKATVEYVITGVLESDFDNGYLSNESPIGSALLGKKAGDEVAIKVPAGVKKFRIVKISAAQ